MNSMTGFGRAELERDGHKISIELKSVNHRFLDMNIRMPRFMLFAEDFVRTRIKEQLTRGRVDVYVLYTPVGVSRRSVRADLPLVRAYLEAARQIQGEAALQDDLTLSTMMRLPDVLVFEEEPQNEEVLKTLLGDTLDLALAQMKEARAAEGARIGQDILDRVDILGKIVDDIETREPQVVAEYREKLQGKLSEILADTQIDENRLAAEVLYFADRASITEEIVRLRSHIAQCKETLAGSAASGRNMDFIVQELNRECNTIGSKSSDVEITKWVLAAKSEVEKIREQVQNIE